MKKILFFLAIVALLFSACSDEFLNVTPKDRYSDATVWKDNSLANAFVNNIYEGQMSTFSNYSHPLSSIMYDQC